MRGMEKGEYRLFSRWSLIGLASLQGRPGGKTGEGKVAGKVDGSRVADGF